MKILRLKRKRILITSNFQEKLQHHLKRHLVFLQKHGNLYDVLTNVLENKSLDNVKLLQVGFLDDLMSGFNVYKKIKGANSAIDLYLYLLRNPRRTVYDLFLNIPTDKYNKDIYLQTLFIYRQKLFGLREDILKKLTNKRIRYNDSDQSSIVEQKYKESIAKKKTKLEPELKPKFEESITEGTILRKQRFSEIVKRETMINNNLFKEYFKYLSPSNMYKNLNTTTDIEENKTTVNKIKHNLADLMVDIENDPTNNAKKN